jgi:hypothetical protein
MRAKAYTFHWFVSGAAGFVNTFAAPVAMKNIGFWFYVFFVFWDLFEAVSFRLLFGSVISERHGQTSSCAYN